MSFFTLRGRPTVATAFQGVPEFALPGQHAFLFGLLTASVRKGACVVDLGSGFGAWARRLASGGFDVTACDIDPERCEIDCLKIDLNEPFAETIGQTADAVTCIEVLEHVENPRHVLREAAKLLKPGGLLLLSTPNASGLHSRAKFLATGRFAMFDDGHYDRIGHIRPITWWELDKMLQETGFRTVSTRFYDHPGKLPRTLGDIAKLLLTAVLKPLLRGTAGGQVLIVLAARP